MNATFSRWIVSLAHTLVAHDHRHGREDGQALVEYALIIALVALAAFAALKVLGSDVAGALQKVANDFP